MRLLKTKMGFQPTFSRHAKTDASIALVIWLNENVDFLLFQFGPSVCLDNGC